MKLSARDRFIAALLPALLTLCAYNWLYARPAAQQLAGLNSRLSAAQSAPASDAVLRERRRTVELLNTAVAKEQARARLLQPHAALPSPSRPERSQSLRTLTRQLTDSGLLLVKTSRTDVHAPAGQAQSDASWLAGKQGMAAPEYWRIELLGSYAQMLDALKSLASSSEFIVPLTVEMEGANKSSAEGESQQKWALVVWL